MFIRTLTFLLGISLSSSAFASSEFNGEQNKEEKLKAEFYQKRYPLQDVYQKHVDNKGEGDERVYGTRNFRAVLNGVLYRGGANNKYNKYGVRDNRNPLPKVGLTNLCEEGFSNGIYLYSMNYDSASPKVSCRSIYGKNQMDYLQLSTYNAAGIKAIFTIVKNAITKNTGPVYMHCWNGWHASGLASALALRQFCGASATEAVNYWDKNTDGNNTDPNFKSIRESIRNFVPFAEFKISMEDRDRICPQW